MLYEPFYNPHKTYEENFDQGPFGAFADEAVFTNRGKPQFEFLGNKVFLPFGIPAGPLINGRFVKAALDKGFDICIYKTVRTQKYPCHPWPNVVSVNLEGDLTLKQAEAGVEVAADYLEPLSITNSFGVPSADPDFWQKDISECVALAKDGQVVVGSFQGTPRGNTQAYIQDFADCAQLLKEAGAKVLEMNLSCPNEGTADLLCFDLARTEQVVGAVKNKIGNTPLIVKIAYFTNQRALEKLIEAVGRNVQGIAAINTIPAKIVDNKHRQVLPGEGRLTSGICGRAIKWAGLDMVKRLKFWQEQKNLDFAIIGVGGVMNVEDYQNYTNAGADTVMSATGAMWNPSLAQEIKKKIL